jgi:hypothetical protein
MPVLGVLTCEILEREFAYLLANDGDLAGITVVEDANSLGLIAALEAAGGVQPRRIPIVRGFAANVTDQLEALVQVLELGLHYRKQFLQEGLFKAAREMGRYVDGIVLGYGLCGNALEKPEELLGDVGVPVFLPMDEDHPVDDCVGLVIGGRQTYYREQCREAGTFFMIPGWTVHWKRLFAKEYGEMDEKMAKRIFSRYKRTLLIPTPALSKEQMTKNIEEFNRRFELREEVQPGTLELLRGAWERAKGAVLQSESA